MKFEYKTIYKNDFISLDKQITMLNKEGQEGWELVGVVSYDGGFKTVFYFKRSI